jgi:hypothetical protein
MSTISVSLPMVTGPIVSLLSNFEATVMETINQDMPPQLFKGGVGETRLSNPKN